mgnify:CR=1 FL=1
MSSFLLLCFEFVLCFGVIESAVRSLADGITFNVLFTTLAFLMDCISFDISVGVALAIALMLKNEMTDGMIWDFMLTGSGQIDSVFSNSCKACNKQYSKDVLFEFSLKRTDCDN